MLRSIKLTNFRKVAESSMTFTEGVNVIRGANEASKTSRLEAISYALFGSKALRTPFDETVTWGEDPRTLKVELTLERDGKTYSISRSKAGAEVLLDGEVFCTGQNEVSSLCALLLGSDINTSQKLFLASQNGIRGALEEGPKALSVMIEDLAGFSVIDDILEAASQKLALGSSALLEERLKGAQATLEAATASLPSKPDEKLHKETLIQLEKKAAEARASIEPLQGAAKKAADTYINASEAYLGRVELERTVQALIASVGSSSKQVASCLTAANVQVDESQVEVLRQQIAEADQYAEVQAAYKKFLALPVIEQYAGTQEDFETDLASLRKSAKDITAEISELEKQALIEQGKRIDHDKCDKCGQDITHLANVQEVNKGVDKALVELNKQLETSRGDLQAITNLEEKGTTHQKTWATYLSAARGLEPFTKEKGKGYPALLVWKGKRPSDVAPAAPRAELAELEAKIKSVAAAKAKLEMASEQHAKATKELEAAMELLKVSTAPDATEIKRLLNLKNEAEQAARVAEGTVIIVEREAETATKEFEQAKALWAANQSRVTDAEKVITECQADLQNLDYNNALVKKLRSIRPVIANRLWNTVLASVSVMFSQMRGETSTVTKGTSGFQVNGQAVESLSGSTLDILGIALRCALLRTFIPDCSMLILDEPAQGMDEARTEALLGFLQLAKMQQIILVTHEDVSTSVASNIIEV